MSGYQSSTRLYKLSNTSDLAVKAQKYLLDFPRKMRLLACLGLGFATLGFLAWFTNLKTFSYGYSFISLLALICFTLLLLFFLNLSQRKINSAKHGLKFARYLCIEGSVLAKIRKRTRSRRYSYRNLILGPYYFHGISRSYFQTLSIGRPLRIIFAEHIGFHAKHILLSLTELEQGARPEDAELLQTWEEDSVEFLEELWSNSAIRRICQAKHGNHRPQSLAALVKALN